MNEEEKRAAFEAALENIVVSIHKLGVAFEAAAFAGRLWDPDNTRSEPDAAQHATITSCRALFASLTARHEGARQMLGLDVLPSAEAPSSGEA
jgi:hypothetical protein